MKRIISNFPAKNPKLAQKFYSEILGLYSVNDLGWINTYGSNSKMKVQISFLTEGGSGTPTPDLTIEVDNVEEAYQWMKRAQFKIEYPLTEEPWGVKRFFVRDPFGKLINILSHLEQE